MQADAVYQRSRANFCVRAGYLAWCFLFLSPQPEFGLFDDANLPCHATSASQGNPMIQTVLLPQGAVGVPYGVFGAGAVLSATGGTGTYTWSIVSGSLPPGLALDPMSGIISGTPTTLGNYVFTVQVTDQASLSYRQQLSIYVQGVVSITPAVLPSGAANVAYPPVQLVATGGLPPYVWCVVESSGTCDQGNGGALPPGLSLSSDGIISG